MKLFMKQTIIALYAIICTTFLYSCKEEEPPVSFAEAEVSIDIKSTTSNSITFSITAENTESAFYRYFESNNQNSGNEYTEIEADSDITLNGLNEKTEYTIAAYGINGDGQRGKEVTASAVTDENPFVRITEIKATSRSVSFKISTTNAVSYGYCVYPEANPENTEMTIVENGESASFEIDGLVPDTDYIIAAEAYNASGDKSEKITKNFKTEIEPEIEVSDCESDGESATITVICKNAEKYYYALTKKTEAEPSEKEYVSDKASDNPTKIYFYELEENQEYRLWTFAESKNGSRGIVSSYDFNSGNITDKKEFHVSVSEITKFDAKINVEWDGSKYSNVYWVAASTETIPDQDNFNWETAISSWQAQEIMTPGEYMLSSFFLDPGTKVRVGFLFKGHDGQEDSEIWKDIDLKRILFGESECSINIEITKTSYSAITYIPTAENGTTGYFFGYTSNKDEIERYAMDMIRYTPLYTFGEEIIQGSLSKETKYYLIAVPIDNEGKFGNIVTIEASTGKPEINGTGLMTATLSESSYCSLKYKIELGNDASSAVYLVFQDGMFQTDEEKLNNLATSYNKIYSSGDIDISYLQNGEKLKNGQKYEIWFSAIDKYGRLGEIVKSIGETQKITVDGNGKAEITVDEIHFEQPAGFKGKITVKPDNNTEGFYYMITSKDIAESFSDTDIMEMILSGQGSEYIKGTYQIAGWDGNGEYLPSDSYLTVLPIDNSGRISPLIKYFIEESASK